MVNLRNFLPLVTLLSIANALPSQTDTSSNPDSHSLFARAVGLAKRANIDNYKGCTADQKTRIQAGYKDALKLADHVWSPNHDELFTAGVNGRLPESSPLLQRYFGDIKSSSSDYQKATNVYNNIRNWWPWPLFDWIFGSRIHVYCADEFGICASNPAIGGYAKNLDDGPRITLCPGYFNTYTFPTLDELKQRLDSTWKDKQKDIASFRGVGQIFLHEMVHLEVIGGKPNIPDVKCDTGESLTGNWYGPYKTEKLAKRWPQCARNNADNYAVFASAYWYSQFYGTPDVPKSKNGLSANSNDDTIGDVDASFNIYTDVAGASSGNGPAFGDPGYFPDVGELSDMANFGKSLQDPPTTLSAIPAQSSPGSAPTQAPGQPIASPGCNKNKVSSIPKGFIVDDGTSDPDDLLYRIREKLCNNDCSAPRGINPSSNALSIGQNSGMTDCEINIAVSSGAEAYCYRQYPAVGVEWQECWDSTQSIIDKCVAQGPNEGWWNGDHAYQYYKCGYRPLNSNEALYKHNLQGWLAPKAPVCQEDCDCTDTVPVRCRCVCRCDDGTARATC